MKDTEKCPGPMHTEFRRALGQLNWIQSRTQFHIAYKFSRSASAAASPTVADVKAINKVIRAVRAKPVQLCFWQFRGLVRMLRIPDASFKNNEDKSSQRGQCVFIAETKQPRKPNTRGSLVDYESKKIRRTTLSTTVAELYAFMKCFGACQFLRGLWMDISATCAPIHMRTGANNLVTTAGTTHLPEQQEAVHMIQMLRKESCSGAIEDLAHVRTEHCLADSLTKNTASADALMKIVETETLIMIDCHPDS